VNVKFEYYRNDYIKNEYQKFLSLNLKPMFSLNFNILKHDFVHTGKASSSIKFTLKRLGVSPSILRRIAIASYEAEINVTAHTNGGVVIGNIYKNFIQILFIDNGPGIEDIEKCMQPGYSTAIDIVREMGFGAGLGLPNIKKNSDVLIIKSSYGDHTELELVIYFDDKNEN
jgi:serine/threonine-protein kinase RsbT